MTVSGLLTFAAVAVAGGVGAVLRYLLGGFINSCTGSRFPAGTAVVNITGSCALGLLIGSAGLSGWIWAPELTTVLGVGLLGGFTTFSTASVETVQLLQSGRWLSATLNGVGVLLCCTGAALLGIWWGTLL